MYPSRWAATATAEFGEVSIVCSAKGNRRATEEGRNGPGHSADPGRQHIGRDCGAIGACGIRDEQVHGTSCRRHQLDERKICKLVCSISRDEINVKRHIDVASASERRGS